MRSFYTILILILHFIPLKVFGREQSIPLIYQGCAKVIPFQANKILVEGLPSRYLHCAVPEQMKLYRKIYNSILTSHLETQSKNLFDSSIPTNPAMYSSQDLSRMSLRGVGDLNSEQAILDVLDNAFALVTYSITNDSFLTQSFDKKTEYLAVVKKVYDLHQRVLRERKARFDSISQKGGYQSPTHHLFTLKEFEHFNYILAHIMESYNSQEKVDYMIIYHHLRLMYELLSGERTDFIPQWPMVISWFEEDSTVWKIVLQNNIARFITALKQGRAKDDFYINLDLSDRQGYIDKLSNIAKDLNGLKEGFSFKEIAPLLSNYNILYNTYKSYLVVNDDYGSLELEQLDNDIKNVLFLIYGNPNPNAIRGISEMHFIEQFINPDYSGFIAAFDVFSTCPKCGGYSDQLRLPAVEAAIRVPKKPHYSITEGTYQMLTHDIEHCTVQQNQWAQCLDDRPIIRNRLASIYDQRKAMDPNSARALVHGLFAVIHELPAFCEAYADNDNKYMTNLATIMKDKLKFDANLNKVIKRYREDSIDWAESLSDITDEAGYAFFRNDGAPFDPVVGAYVEEEIIDGEYSSSYQKAIENSFERYWDYFQRLIPGGS